jgi:hypothetical protein
MRFAIITLLSAFVTLPAAADGRSDWTGYDWRRAPFGKCISTVSGCHAFHAKWDWKRDQWIDISYGREPSGHLVVDKHLTNKDPQDSDFVCITVLFLDAEGRNLAASHRNVEVGPLSSMTVRDELTPLTPALANSIKTVDFGSKQCREGASQDDDVFEAVKARLP